MKKSILWGLMMCLLCFFVACGQGIEESTMQEENEVVVSGKESKEELKEDQKEEAKKKGVGDVEIKKDIQSLYDFTVQDFNITTMDIIKRQTDVEQKTDLIYIHIEAENDDFKIIRNYQLVYELYNEGWILEESAAYVKDEYHDETIPLHGVSLDVVKSDFQEVGTYDKIGEKWFSQSYCDSIYYDIEHIYSDVYTDCYYQEIELKYNYFIRKTGINITYNLEGYDWIPTVQMEHEYYLNDEINGYWEMYVEAGHPMQVDSTISVNLKKVDNANCYCDFRWTSRIAGGHDDVFEGTFTIAERYDEYGDMVYILLAKNNLYGSIQLTPTGVLYDVELSTNTYELQKR